MLPNSKLYILSTPELIIWEKALMYAFQNQKRLIDDYTIKFVIEHEMLGTITT